MKTGLGACVIAIALSAWLSPAVAQRHVVDVLAQARSQTQVQPEPPAQRDPRELRGERRMAPQRDERPHNRLTEEERRGLRHDIDQANRDIYRRQRGR